jgi:large subunit ribosomal protein L23
VSNIHSTILGPAITEKNTALKNSQNKYVFEVQPKATKVEIRQAVEKLFGVKVISVNTMVVKGKKKRTGRNIGHRSDRKKAIVRLEAGQSISQFGEA